MRHKILLWSAFWTLLAITWITPADAYEFPPYEGLKLKITGNISEDYSNNITFANDAKDQEEDFRTMLALGIDLKYEGKKRSIGFSGIANRRIEFDNSDISNSSELITVFLNNEFTEYDRISVSNSFRHTQEPDSFRQGFDLDACEEYYEDYGFSQQEIDAECRRFEDEFGRFRGRFDSYNNRAGIVYHKTASEQLKIDPYYFYVENWSSEEGTQDSRQNVLGGKINYRYSPATIFTLMYKYLLTDYEEGDNITQQSVSTGIKQYITKRLFFKGLIGGDFVSDRDDSISGLASLTAELSEATEGSLSYSQGARISPNEEDVFRNWRISGSLSALLLEDLSGSLSAFYGKGDFVTSDVTDTLTGASFTLSYNFWTGQRGSRFYGSTGYTYSDLDSTDENRGYTRNSVNTTLSLAF